MSPAPVRVRVAEPHTSDARVPKVVRDLVPADQTAVVTDAGRPVIDEVIEARVAPSEEEAFRILVFAVRTLVLIEEVAEAMRVSVLILTAFVIPEV